MWMLGAYPLYQRASLLKLSHRRGMNPHVELLSGIVSEPRKCLLMTGNQPSGLSGFKRGNTRGGRVQGYSGVVDWIHSAGMIRSIPARKRANVSSRPSNAVMSNICGPLHSPTTVRRKAFITLPR